LRVSAEREGEGFSSEARLALGVSSMRCSPWEAYL
jgi:hypothetical protein